MVLLSMMLTIAKWIKRLQSLSPSLYLHLLTPFLYFILYTADPNSMQNTHVKDRPSTHMALLSMSLSVRNSVDGVAAQC